MYNVLIDSANTYHTVLDMLVIDASSTKVVSI